MAFKLFNGILLPIGKVLSKNNELIQTVEINKKVISIASKNLQSGVLHHDPLLEKEIFNIIKEGRVEDLKDFSILRDEESVGILSKSSYIRSLKNNIIVLITLVTRSSIEGGLHPEFAFALSDTFIQQLEELNNFNEIKELAQEVRYTFTYKVSQIKKNRYSKTITLCQNYIFTNIYENINHNDIAEMIGLSPQHLSSLFKKEVGISLSEFRQQEQVNEAKKLILYSNTPFSEVSALLNFSDQSYFTKVFKKHVGITPKQYKERSYLLEE